MPRAFFGAEADPVSAAHAVRRTSTRMRSAQLGTLRVAFNWARGGADPGAPRDWILLRHAGRPGRARPREHHGRAGRAARPWRRRPAPTRPPRRPGAPPSAASCATWSGATAMAAASGAPTAAPAPAGLRLPGLERAELPAALGRGPVAARVDVRAFLKEHGQHDPARRPQGEDRHRRACWPAPRAGQPGTATWTSCTRCRGSGGASTPWPSTRTPRTRAGVEGELPASARHAQPRRRPHAGVDLRARLGHRRRQRLLLDHPRGARRRGSLGLPLRGPQPQALPREPARLVQLARPRRRPRRAAGSSTAACSDTTDSRSPRGSAFRRFTRATR